MRLTSSTIFEVEKLNHQNLKVKILSFVFKTPPKAYNTNLQLCNKISIKTKKCEDLIKNIRVLSILFNKWSVFVWEKCLEKTHPSKFFNLKQIAKQKLKKKIHNKSYYKDSLKTIPNFYFISTKIFSEEV